MTFSDYEYILALVNAHPEHKIVGRTRFQKEVKLLQQIKFPTTYVFGMHYYGPYSEELQSDIEMLRDLKALKEEERTDALKSYSYHLSKDILVPDVTSFQPQIDIMANTDTVVLELAATYIAFQEIESDPAEALKRLRRKKGEKCTLENEKKAFELLDRLNIPTSQPVPQIV